MVEKTVHNVPVRFVVDGYLQQVTPEEVNVTVKIPRVIIKKDMDYKTLFSVTALSPLENGEMKVKVTVASDVKVPLEVVKIEPETVTLVKKPAPKKPDAQEKKP